MSKKSKAYDDQKTIIWNSEYFQPILTEISAWKFELLGYFIWIANLRISKFALHVNLNARGVLGR